MPCPYDVKLLGFWWLTLGHFLGILVGVSGAKWGEVECFMVSMNTYWIRRIG